MKGRMSTGDLILDRYRPLGTAGVGGFGTVQVAWDPRIQRKVAIKTIKLTELDAYRAGLSGAEAIAASPGDEGLPWEDYPDTATDAYGAYDAEFGGRDDSDLVPALAHLPGLDEARTAAMLSDPHIVTVYDFEIRGLTAYLIMEYIEGITLTQLLRDYGDKLTLDIVAYVFDSVASALRAAHDAGVLHLDIKPDNILITPQGQVKVTDFGLATLADAAGEGTTGGGTIGYMPLEQMRREFLDARTDEWALASVTYEMLVGENPFVVPSLDEAEGAIEDAELVLPSLCWDELDAEVDDVVFTALDPDRDDRYDSVDAFADELMPYLGDELEGRMQLTDIVSDALGIVSVEGEDDEPQDEDRTLMRAARTPMRARLNGVLLAVLARVFAALGSGFVMFIGASNLSPLLTLTPNPTAAVLVTAAVAAALGAVIPHVGALVAFLFLGIVLIANGSPIAGVVLIVAAGAWWWFAGRGGKAAANVALSLPLAGAIGGSVFTPLVAGVSLKPLRALGTAAFAAVCALVFGAMGTGNMLGWNAVANWRFASVAVDTAFVSMLSQPATWCMVASWIAAAAVGALVSLQGSKAASIVGLVASFALLVVGSIGAVWFDSGQVSFTPSVQLAASLVISVIVVFAGVFWLRSDAPEGEE